jgi:hypothetical protein
MAKTAHVSAPIESDIQLERWPIDRLIPRATNPRTHSREQVANIALPSASGDGRILFWSGLTTTSSPAMPEFLPRASSKWKRCL